MATSTGNVNNGRRTKNKAKNKQVHGGLWLQAITKPKRLHFL
jgi:hypothetical protein